MEFPAGIGSGSDSFSDPVTPFGPYNIHEVTIGSHTGTHFDPPAHFLDGDAKTAGAVDPGLLVGPGIIVDVRGKGPREAVTPDDLAAYKDRIAPATIVVFMTGWDAKERAPDYFDHPYLAAETGRVLLDKGVRTIGIDTINVDPSWGEVFPVHVMFAKADALVVEALANLPSVAGPETFFVFAPLKLMQGSGAPIRALALEFDDP